MKPRDYQLAAIDAVHKDFNNGLRRLGISLPCALGKTVIISEMTRRVRQQRGTAVVLVHRDVLVDQTVRKLMNFVDHDDIGVVKASRNEVHKPVIVASVQTLARSNRLDQLRPPTLTLVDEAHISRSPTFDKVFEHFDTVPGGRGCMVGVTATWSRSDNKGLGDIFEKISFKRSIKWAVDNKYIVPPNAIQLGGNIDLSEVRTGSDGDYVEKDAGEAVMIEDVRDAVVQGYHALAQGRSAALFAPTQASAEFFLQALHESGVKVAGYFATTKKKDRIWADHGYSTGAIKVLGTCTALSVGWDAPICDTILLVRPTKHAGTFIQIVGRAMRLWPGKKDALILDFVGATDDVSIKAEIDLSTTPEQKEKEEKGWDELEEEETEHVPISPMAKKIDGVHHIDLFAGTTARWLKTDFGMPFISTSEKSKSGTARTFFIAPINGAWNVGVTGSVKSFSGGRWLAEGVTAPEAMEIGSEAALDDDPTIVHKKAAWRRGDASEKQLVYARSIGVNPDGMNKTQVADAITVRLASRTLGTVYRPVYENLEGPG
jgi:superfamily II DNA or RNA helicase